MAKAVIVGLLVVGMTVGMPGVVGDEEDPVAPIDQIVTLCSEPLIDPDASNACEDAIRKLNACITPGDYTLEDRYIPTEPNEKGVYYYAIPFTYRSKVIDENIIPNPPVQYEALAEFMVASTGQVSGCQ